MAEAFGTGKAVGAVEAVDAAAVVEFAFGLLVQRCRLSILVCRRPARRFFSPFAIKPGCEKYGTR